MISKFPAKLLVQSLRSKSFINKANVKTGFPKRRSHTGWQSRLNHPTTGMNEEAFNWPWVQEKGDFNNRSGEGRNDYMVTVALHFSNKNPQELSKTILKPTSRPQEPMEKPRFPSHPNLLFFMVFGALGCFDQSQKAQSTPPRSEALSLCSLLAIVAVGWPPPGSGLSMA